MEGFFYEKYLRYFTKNKRQSIVKNKEKIKLQLEIINNGC